MSRDGLLRRVIVAGLVAGGLASCSDGPTTIVFLDPCCTEVGQCLRGQATHAQVLVFDNGCPTDEALEAGSIFATVFDQVLAADAPPPPSIGKLGSGTFGFANILRDQQCRVVGFGCVEANLSQVGEIRIELRAWTRAALCTPLDTGGCGMGQSCTAGRCQ